MYYMFKRKEVNMKFLNLKFNAKELGTLRNALDNPNNLVKGHEDMCKEVINQEIRTLNRLVDYIKSKERLFI